MKRIRKPISFCALMPAAAGCRWEPKDKLTFEKEVSDGWCVLVPAGTWHNITNIGSTPMQVHAIYAPAHHTPDKVRVTAAGLKPMKKMNRRLGQCNQNMRRTNTSELIAQREWVVTPTVCESSTHRTPASKACEQRRLGYSSYVGFQAHLLASKLRGGEFNFEVAHPTH
ncbi:MAG: hypothetical protein ABIR10_04310 [Dokdonella sp.]